MFIKVSVLFIATIFAFWISAICGGGASLVLVPLLNLLLPGSVIPFSLTIGTFTSSASRIAVFKKHIRWKIVYWFVPFSVPAVVLGAWVMKFVNPIYLQFIVSLFLLANVPELVRNKKAQTNEEKPYPPYILPIVGFLAGLISGITGAIGLLFNRFYLRYELHKEEIIATRAANEILLHCIKLIVYILLGLYSKNAIWLGLAIAAASVLSSYSIKFILPFLSEFVFRKIGYAAMVFSGIFLMSNSAKQIITQDQIAVSKNKYNETTMQWRKSNFVLEFAIDDGLEIERPIQPDELPTNLKIKYDKLLPEYESISLEKVFTLGKAPSYEFYCYKKNALSKFEWDENE